MSSRGHDGDRAHPEGVSASCPCRPGNSVREAMRADIDRCLVLAELDQGSAGTLASRVRALTFYPSLYGVLAYRLAHAAKTSSLGPISLVLTTLAVYLQHAVTAWCRVELSAQAHIGPGLFVNHAQGVVVGPIDAGCNVTLSHNVTLGEGTRAGSGRRTCPELGDRVWIGVGAVVTGGLHLGDDAMIGANSVVLSDVPARGFAAGSPAQVLSLVGSFDNVLYRGMETDPARLASRAHGDMTRPTRASADSDITRD